MTGVTWLEWWVTFLTVMLFGARVLPVLLTRYEEARRKEERKPR